MRKHKPIHVSLVGGEPLMRHRELSSILPALSEMGVFALVVTSAVIPIPVEWTKTPRVRVAVSVDGLPEHHDIRRKPATCARILKNIKGREINIHWVITRPMLARPSYLEEYVSFWNSRPEVNRIWVSVYTPQLGEQSPEMLTSDDREALARNLPSLQRQYPKLLMTGAWPALSFIPLAIQKSAFSRRCLRIIRPICKVVSSLAFLEVRLTALSAVVRSAALYTGLGPSRWRAL